MDKRSEIQHLRKVEQAMKVGSQHGSNLIKANMNIFKSDVLKQNRDLSKGIHSLKKEIKQVGLYNEDDDEDAAFDEAFY